MPNNRKFRRKTSPNNHNGNGHRPSKSTVIAVKNGTAVKTKNSIDNFSKIVDADELEEDLDEDEEEDQEQKTNRTRKIWLATISIILLGGLIGTAVNNLRQYQVKSIPLPATTTSPSPGKETSQLVNSEPAPKVETLNAERDSYFDLAQSGYNQVIADYVSSNGYRHYTQAIGQQSKGKSAHRLLLQKLSSAIKQHELLIGRNESIAVSNPDSMKLLGTSLDVLSMLNALQRLCQSADTCDGTQNFNDFTVPSADALVNLRLYQTEEITALTQTQEFQIRKQIIQEKARQSPVKPDEKAAKNNKADNNNSGLQRAN